MNCVTGGTYFDFINFFYFGLVTLLTELKGRYLNWYMYECITNLSTKFHSYWINGLKLIAKPPMYSYICIYIINLSNMCTYLICLMFFLNVPIVPCIVSILVPTYIFKINLFTIYFCFFCIHSKLFSSCTTVSWKRMISIKFAYVQYC